MRLPSIVARLSFLYAVAVVIVFTLVGIYFERAIGQHFDALDAAELEGKIEIAQQTFGLSGTARSHRSEDFSRALVGHSGLALVVLDRDGRDVFVSTQDGTLADALRREAQSAKHGSNTRVIFAPERLVVVAANVAEHGGAPLRIAAAKNGHDHEHFIAELRVQFWMALAMGVLVLGLAGSVIARWSLRPVKAIAAKAHSISAQRLDARVDVGTVPDELRELVQAFNEMLDRLAQDFKRLADFSADIAHELRTPLSNIITQTQVSLGKARNTEEYQELLASNVEEFERMSRIIGDMLFLAKADNGLVGLRAEALRLEDTVARVLEYYSVLAEDSNVRFRLEGTAGLMADRGLMERLVANLISNAVRHAEHGSEIDVNIGEDAKANQVTLAVTNCGQAIPEAGLSRIFDRFYRADPARCGSAEHTGLGLAIARSIVRAHGGDIAAFSQAGKTTFRVVLPSSMTPRRTEV